MKTYFKDRENRIFIAIFVIVMFVACSKLMTKLCINGHDIEYHLLRVEALKEGILMGRPFLKVNVLFFGGAGYASSMFYPDFLLYVPAILRAVGVGINASYHVFIALCIILCYFSTYYSVKGISGNKYAGLISAIVLTLCNYHIDDIYVRSAVGEYTAIIFIPLVIYGIYNVVFENMSKPYVLGIGFSGLLLCHTLSFAICAAVTVVIFLINIRTFIKNPKIIIKVIATAVISIVVTCSYWLPMLEQFLSDSFYVSTEQWIELAQSAKQTASVFYPAFPTLGFAVVLACLPIIFLKKKDIDDSVVYSLVLIVLSAGFIFMTTDLFPWNRFGRFFSSLQFPWRLFLITSTLLSMSAGVILLKIMSSYKLEKLIVFTDKSSSENVTESLMGKLVLFIVVCIMSLTAFDAMSENDLGYYDYSNDYYTYKPFTSTVIGGEWLPSRVSDVEGIVDMSEKAVNQDGNSIAFVRNKNELSFTSTGNSKYVDVPFIYYKGYCAKADNNQELLVDGSGINGMTRVYTDSYEGEVRVYYKGTLLQMVSKGISFCGVVLLFVIFFVDLRRKKK